MTSRTPRLLEVPSQDEAVNSIDGIHIRNLHADQVRQTAHEIVRETLRHAILNGDLPSGTRLVQAELAAQLKVSTTPVREALRDLASDQLIRFDPHRGATVHRLDLTELREVYEIRKALEPLAIRLAAPRLTNKAIRVALALQASMEESTDPGEWVEKNRRFHAALEGEAGSPRLAALVKSVQDSAALYVAHAVHLDPSMMKKANADHRRILAALRDGHGVGAAEILRRHLDATLQAILTSTAAPAPEQVAKSGRQKAKRRAVHL